MKKEKTNSFQLLGHHITLTELGLSCDNSCQGGFR